MGTTYSIIGKHNYSRPSDVFKKKQLEKLKNIRNMSENDYPPINKRNLFYPLEQLCFFSYDELLKFCKEKNIKINPDKPLEINIFDWQIEKFVSKSKKCENMEKAYNFYKGDGFKEVNDLLRRKDIDLPYNFYPLIAFNCNDYNGSTLNCIYQLDNYIEKCGKFGDDETFVYRGLTPPQLVVVKRSIKNDMVIRKSGEIYFRESLPDKAFISASKSIDVASGIVESHTIGDKKYNCCILKFRIPEKIKFLDKDFDSEEQEILLQRGILFYNFKELGKDNNDIYVIECEIKSFYDDLDNFYKSDCPILKYYNNKLSKSF